MKLTALLTAASCDKIPPGWMTGEQLARREGCSTLDSFRPILRRAIAAGFLETKNFRARWGNQTRPRPYYRYTKPGKKP